VGKIPIKFPTIPISSDVLTLVNDIVKTSTRVGISKNIVSVEKVHFNQIKEKISKVQDYLDDNIGNLGQCEKDLLHRTMLHLFLMRKNRLDKAEEVLTDIKSIIKR